MTATLADDPVLGLLVRTGLALLFASAAWHKLRDRSTFSGVLAAYRMVPDAAIAVVVGAVPALELAVALAWVTPGASLVAAAGTVALLALYAVAIAVNLVRGRSTIDCGCGVAGARQPISEWLLVRNGALAVLALVPLRAQTARPLGWIDVLTLAAALAVATCVWTAAHGLAAAAARVRVIEARAGATEARVRVIEARARATGAER
jgi:methylamine utilization protein MauE